VVYIPYSAVSLGGRLYSVGYDCIALVPRSVHE